MPVSQVRACVAPAFEGGKRIAKARASVARRLNITASDMKTEQPGIDAVDHLVQTAIGDIKASI